MLASLVVLLLAAQDLPKKAIETAHLTIVASTSPESAAGGRKLSLVVDVAPKTKMHVYSPGQDGYIAVTLTLEANAAFTAAKAKYPAPEKLFLPAINETQLVYAKPFRITQDLILKAGQRAEAIVVKGTLRYQACDDRICYLPTSVPLTWNVPVAR
jgi:DsbC/DsbD-like thiol-disulfide interchange protein